MQSIVRTVPFSARITPEDVEFLAGLDIEGAQTPSDKLRALLQEARRRRDAGRDFSANLQLAQESLAPAKLRLQASEHQEQLHSEVLARVLDNLPALLASLGTATTQNALLARQQLLELERSTAEQVVRLATGLIHAVMCEQSGSYDRLQLVQRLQPMLELSELFTSKLMKEKERLS